MNIKINQKEIQSNSIIKQNELIISAMFSDGMYLSENELIFLNQLHRILLLQENNMIDFD